MDYRTLGKTGIRMPIMGMGSGGGPDPLGQASGKPLEEVEALLHRAFELGINYFDTSPTYLDSEVLLGRFLKAFPREDLTISTKIPLAAPAPGEPAHIMSAQDIRDAVNNSLKRLDMEYIDIMLIAVAGTEYFDPVVQDQIPVLQELQRAGKIRHLGSSELTRDDGTHEWLQKLLPTGLIEVAMLGHNMINQQAQETVLPYCLENDIGVINVFTVRRVFGQPGRLEEVLQDLGERGVIDPGRIDLDAPLQFLLEDGEADSLIECAYRYASYTPGITTVMNGANEIHLLEQNIRSILKGPLAEDKRKELKSLFREVSEPIGN